MKKEKQFRWRDIFYILIDPQLANASLHVVLITILRLRLIYVNVNLVIHSQMWVSK